MIACLEPSLEWGSTTDMDSYEHQPVMLSSVLKLLLTNLGGLYLDGTLGLGGHAEGILRALSPQGRLLGLDLDPESLFAATRRLQGHANFIAVRSNFKDAGRVLEENKFFPLAGALFDLGVSSMHFDRPERGFSFSHEGPLDMRLSPDNPLTAETIVNRWPEEQLALLFKEYGEEPAANRLARSICAGASANVKTTPIGGFIASAAARQDSSCERPWRCASP